MGHAKVLALILAGGEGNRMDVLTQVRAKPALPYAGVYRLIDVPLSNCVHSGLTDVWIVEQFQPHSINEHLVNGRPWDLDRTYGGLRLMSPHQGTSESGWHQGNADAIYRNRRFIRDFDPDVILVLSADHIYKLDYRKVLDAHHKREAAVTMVTTEVQRAEATRFGNVQVDSDGKVTQFAYKPDEPISTIATTEVFVYDARTLLTTLDKLASEAGGSDEQSGLEDFGHQLLPQLVDQGRAYAYALNSYWRDLGTIESYVASHMDLLNDDPPLDLDDPQWPILTRTTPRVPARILGSAHVTNSFIAPGCEIRGRVTNSVLGSGVTVHEGAEIQNAIIFQDTVIGPGAQIRAAIIDQEVQIAERVQIGGDSSDSKITLVGLGAQIRAGTRIAPGEHVQPGA